MSRHDSLYEPPGGDAPLLQWSSPSMLEISPTHCSALPSVVGCAGPCLGLHEALRVMVWFLSQTDLMFVHDRTYEPLGGSQLKPGPVGSCTLQLPGGPGGHLI